MIDQHGPAVTTTDTPGRKPLGAKPFWWGIAAITVAQVLLRGWAAAGGWFYWDDFWWHDIVADNSLLDATGLSLGGHYSPLTYIPYYLLTAAFPYEWTSRVVVMLVTLLGINAGVLAVARRLWPTRGPQLTVYVLWAFSTLAAPSWLWYSQFSMIGALLLTSTWTLWAYLRALASDDIGPSVLAVGLLTVSLFAQERMLVMTVLLTAFLWWVARPGLRALRFRGRTGLWTGSAAVVVVWWAVYARALPDSVVAPSGLVESLRIGIGMLRVSAVPALWGGPWVLNDEPVLRRAGTPWTLQLVAVAILVALVVWSVRRSRRALRSWAVLALGLCLTAAVVVIGRGATLGQIAVTEWRYFSDLAVLAPVLIVAAFVSPGTCPRFAVRELNVAKGLLAAYVVACLVTTIPLGLQWHETASRGYLRNAVAQLSAAGPVAVTDRWLPEYVVNPVLGQQRLASRVLSILDLPVRFDAPTTSPLWLDDRGSLVPAAMAVERQSPGLGECPYPVRGYETTWIPLPGSMNVYDWGVRIDYWADSDVRAAVTDGPRTIVVDLPAGQHGVYVHMPGVGGQLGVFLVEATKSICVRTVSTGTMGPG